MVNSHHVDCVTSHVNQTYLVDQLLHKGVLHYDDISWLKTDTQGDDLHVYQWLVFPKFWDFHYEKLEEAQIPVLDTDHWTWVGITSFGSPYELYVYPSLIEALFGEKALGEYLDFNQQKAATV